MKELRSDLAKIISQFAPFEGPNETPIPGVHCIKFSQTEKRTRKHWRACFGILAQGAKEVVLGSEVHLAREGHYTATPIDLPVLSRVAQASKEKPMLGILIDFNSLVVSEIASQISDDQFLEVPPVGAVFAGKASDAVLESTIRLAKLFHSPEDARVLGPLIVREIIYHLLKGEDGAAIRQFVRSGSKMHKVAKAIHKIQSDLSLEIDVEALAKSANLSRSAFFKHFKEATAMSPIQYQKRLRLLEARRLMMDEGETAEGSAYKVGYNSASQFSREYSRMFGKSPLRDVAKIKKTVETIYSI